MKFKTIEGVFLFYQNDIADEIRGSPMLKFSNRPQLPRSRDFGWHSQMAICIQSTAYSFCYYHKTNQFDRYK